MTPVVNNLRLSNIPSVSMSLSSLSSELTVCSKLATSTNDVNILFNSPINYKERGTSKHEQIVVLKDRDVGSIFNLGGAQNFKGTFPFRKKGIF